MRDGAVVALQEVLARDLPVGADLPVGPVVERQRIDVEPVGGESLRDLSEQLRERQRGVVEVDEAKRPPRFHPHGHEGQLLHAVELLGARRRAEGSVQIVGPGVVRALQRPSVAGLLDHDRSAVPADVDERSLGSVGVPDEHDRHLACPAWLDVALSEAADVVPGAPEDRLFLVREHRRIAVPVPRDRLHCRHLAGASDDRQHAHMENSGEVDRLIYRDEVLGIIGALSDIVVELRDIRELLENDEEEEDESGA